MRKRFRYRSAILAFNLALAAAGSAHALTITANFGSSITGDPNAATIETTINSAIATYETLFLDPINVSITFNSVSSGLGSSSTFQKTDTYSDFIDKLTRSATSASDTTALAHLPTGTTNPVDGNTQMTLSTANASALGIFTGNSTIGGSINLNTSLMNLSRGGTIDPNKYDLFGVVSHEIDEVLGFGSSLINGNNGKPTPTGPITPEDLFRYDQNGNRSYNYGTDAATQAYFSIDGTTQLARFNQTSNSTNSGDFGDWYSFSVAHTPQVQDAYATPGVSVNLDTAEKTVFDVIGYTLLTTLTWNPTSATSAVPPDGSGTWTTASGSTWWNGTSNSIWTNGTVQNAQFGTAGTASTTAYTVTLGSAITVGTMTFANQNYTINGGGNSLTIDNGILAVANATVNAPIILGGANSWETVGTATLTVAGNVSGGFGITKQGPGTLILSGVNTFTGGTTVNAGTLMLNSATALPASGNVIVSGGALDIHGQTPSIGSLTFGDGVSTNAASLIDSAATKGSITLGGDITYTGTLNGSFTYFPAATISANIQLASGTHHLTTADSFLSDNNYDVVVSGILSGPGGLTKDGGNNVALTGANTYSGATIINNGFFYAAATNTLSASSAVTVNSPGVLDLNPGSSQTGVVIGNYNQIIGSLAGAGQVTLGSATLSIGNDGTSTTYSGSAFGTGGFTKIGAGTLTLTGNNGYTGATTINAGALQLGNGGSIASSSGVTGLAGGTLIFNYSTNPGFSIPISGGIGVTQAGTGSLFLLANNTYTGTTTISSGTVIVGFNGTTGSLGTGNTVNSGTLTFEHTDILTVASPISGSGSLNQNSSGGIALTGANTYVGPTTIFAGKLQLGNGGTSGSLAAATTIFGNSGTTFSFNRSDTFTVGNAISGGLTVAQNGTGTTILSATSGYTGPTSVNSGTLLVTGSISGSTTAVNSGGTLGGTGTVGAVNAVSGGSVTAGNGASSGLLKTSAFSLASGAHLSLELGGTTGTNTAGTLYSEFNVTGTVSLGGDVQISLFGGYTPAVNDTFFIILNDGSDPVTGTFSNAVGGIITSAGFQYQVNYLANGDGGATANDVSLKVLAVPEPGSWTLLLSGLALASSCRRYRRPRRA